MAQLFSTHPATEKRIAKLQQIGQHGLRIILQAITVAKHEISQEWLLHVREKSELSPSTETPLV